MAQIPLTGDLKVLDFGSGFFVQADQGQTSHTSLLAAILIELRVHTQYLQAMNLNIIQDDPAQMRLDAASDPSSLTTFNPTVGS